jgi:hypothetical protein
METAMVILTAPSKEDVRAYTSKRFAANRDDPPPPATAIQRELGWSWCHDADIIGRHYPEPTHDRA